MPPSQTAFYNAAVQHTSRFFHRLSLGMVILLLGLLSIGPFLHSHVGASVVSGFHLDGVRSVQLNDTAGASAVQHTLNVNDDESPALGVATSLPNSDQDHLFVGDIGTLLVALLLARLACLPQRTRLAWPSPVPAHTYQPGWPPPALAPPLS